MSELIRGYGRIDCLDKYGRFDFKEMYRRVYHMQVKGGVKQKVVAHMFDISVGRVGQIKREYKINKDKADD